MISFTVGIFWGGEYPNLSLFTLVQLRNLKRSLEENFDNIEHDTANNSQQIKWFLLAQWRIHHENILTISTPLNHNSYLTIYEAIIEHCNIKQWETDSDDDVKFDDEFLCNTCNQEKCVGYGFKSAGAHSPSYGNKELRYRTNKSAYLKSVSFHRTLFFD
jgi:hypothetical protein